MKEQPMSQQSPAKGKGNGKKELHHMRLFPSANGGHLIEHHEAEYDADPEPYVFSKDEGEKALAHVNKHMGMK